MRLIANQCNKMNTKTQSNKAIALLNIDEIFNSSTQYKVPMYQRGFAWDKNQLAELIFDIKNSKINKKYFLGTLTVYRLSEKDDVYEVIDGQQRLTALFLIKCALQDNPNATSIEYECRDKASQTLKLFAKTKLEDCLDKKQNNTDFLDEDLLDRLQEIHDIFQSKDFIGDDVGKAFIDFKSKMKTLRLVRVEVPQGTDLNLYFERMNTRAEQLEQADIVKALLMKSIDNSHQCSLFASIWTACSNMSGFVQMGFPPELRKKLFKGSWMTLNNNELETLFDSSYQSSLITSQDDCPTLIDIISDQKKFAETYKTDQTGKNSETKTVQLKSIIDFPVFLIHVLKIFKHTYQREQTISDITPHDLDDIKLVKYFKDAMEEVSEQLSPYAFAVNFVKCLLKVRFLFDKFIVKRELLSSESDLSDNGVWRITSLKKYTEGKKETYSSVATLDGELEGTAIDNENLNHEQNDQCKMIQSCLRVAYTSPRSMHWITLLLDNIYTHYQNGLNEIFLKNISAQAKGFAIKTVRDYLDTKEGCRPYSLGVGTPHIVFHFLDFLLWENDKEKNKAFEFKFRNSVEHWYPQHISSDVGGEWSHEEGLDDFGNLCIVTTSVNSKFSNQSPVQKLGNTDLIKEGSLKLKKMAEITEKLYHESRDANEAWKKEYYIKHQNEMIKLLMNACK